MDPFDNSSSRSSTLSNKFLEQLRGLDFQLDDFTIEMLMQRVPFLSENQAVLGINEDRRPILFDLNNERLSSLLIVNDHLPSIRKFMLSFIRSLQPSNSPFQLQYVVISDLPNMWMARIQENDQNYEFCGGVVGGEELSAQDWVLFLAQKAEQRIEAREPGATIVLFVDDLAIVDRMDVLSKENFTWLLKYGSSVNIWIFAGLDLQKVDDPSRWAALFATRIYGCIANSLRSSLSDFISNQQLSQIQARNCFLTKTGTQWIRFWAPKLQG